MPNLTEPSLETFLLQAFLLPTYIPLSYFAYRVALVPQKRHQIRQALIKLGVRYKDEDLEKPYRVKHYAWPLILAYVLTFAIYTTTHPYVIQQGWWAGIWEEMIDIFGPNNPYPRAMVAGRFLFWGWMGAYIYSVNLTFRRFLDYDLTPSVYIFTAVRFFLAMTVGAIVGVGIGTFLTSSGISFNICLTMVSIIAFTIGFFPEAGISWIITTTKKILKQYNWQTSEELPLSEISGLNSIWQQGRLNQIGIENVNNLAEAKIENLIINTPYNINQIISWVDEAILRDNTTKKQFEALNRSRSASAVIENTNSAEKLKNLAEATGLAESDLKQLATTLATSSKTISNIKYITRLQLKEKAEIAKMKKAFEKGLPIPPDEAEDLIDTKPSKQLSQSHGATAESNEISQNGKQKPTISEPIELIEPILEPIDDSFIDDSFEVSNSQNPQESSNNQSASDKKIESATTHHDLSEPTLQPLKCLKCQRDMEQHIVPSGYKDSGKMVWVCPKCREWEYV